jgi:hypothetical protein
LRRRSNKRGGDNMDENKKKALKEMKKIRDTGDFNMFMDRRRVIQYANKEGFFNLVSFVGNDMDKYAELLDADWSKIE